MRLKNTKSPSTLVHQCPAAALKEPPGRARPNRRSSPPHPNRVWGRAHPTHAHAWNPGKLPGGAPSLAEKPWSCLAAPAAAPRWGQAQKSPVTAGSPGAALSLQRSCACHHHRLQQDQVRVFVLQDQGKLLHQRQSVEQRGVEGYGSELGTGTWLRPVQQPSTRGGQGKCAPSKARPQPLLPQWATQRTSILAEDPPSQ